MSTKLSPDAAFTVSLLDRQADAILPTPYGDLRMIAYSKEVTEYAPHLALAHPDLDPDSEVVVRIHSECITGDLFGSQRCDCGAQLDFALQTISEKRGVVLYLRQEGRGIGIINKLKAYRLQDDGLDTIEANLHLGLQIDARHYDIAQQMLVDLGIKRIQLLTNNPEKIHAFDHGPISLVRRLPIVIDPTRDSAAYLNTKRDAMGHFL
ncbi:MAG: GTP cyclohydrolase II [Bacteroidota bacterium]